MVDPLLPRGSGLVRGDKSLASAGTTIVLGYGSDLTMAEGGVSTSGRRLMVYHGVTMITWRLPQGLEAFRVWFVRVWPRNLGFVG